MRRAAAITGLELLVRPVRAEAALWRRLRFEEGEECRQALFDRYAALARSIARRHYHRRAVKRVDRTDFEQFAFEGLLQAIDRYDPLRGVPFGAFARRRIAGSIVDGIAKMSEVDAQLGHRRRIEQERMRSLARASGTDTPEDPLAELAELAVGLALGLMLEGTSLGAAESGADCRPGAYETLEWREMQIRLAAAVAELPPREADVLRNHYEHGLSFAQVAELLGLSRGRVSQLHRAAVERLRRRMAAYA